MLLVNTNDLYILFDNTIAVKWNPAVILNNSRSVFLKIIICTEN